MRSVRRIINGCRSSETMGHHPGTPILAGCVILGAVAGLDKGVAGSFFGAVIMAVTLGVPYLIGAYDRGRIHEEMR